MCGALGVRPYTGRIGQVPEIDANEQGDLRARPRPGPDRTGTRCASGFGVGQCAAVHAATAVFQVPFDVTIFVSGHFESQDDASGNAPEPSHTIVLPEHETL